MNRAVYGVVLCLSLFGTRDLLCRTMGEYNGRVLKKDREFHTVQIASFPVSSHERAAALHDSLKKEGCFVFYEKAILEDHTAWVRVRVGYFKDRAGAENLCKQFRDQGLSECFVDKTKLIIVPYGTKFSIIQTPSSIWLLDDGQATEMFDLSAAIFDRRIDAHYTQPFVSPSGREVLFEFDHRIMQLDLQTGEISALADGVANALPQRSPSGRYIGYIDQNIWESKSNLWVMRENGSKTCLVDARNEDEEVAVKFFRWHPQKDIILFCEGYAFGTVTVGGNIYSIDMSGERKLLVAGERRANQEIVSEFDIEGGVLVYTIAYFDSNHFGIVDLVEHSRPLDELLP